MKKFDIEATRNLPDHDQLLQSVLGFFYEIPGVTGCFLSGSMSTLEMDEDSDLDVGVVFRSAEDRESIWRKRWEWEIAAWFHRLDADHIKPYFVIYFYEPQIKGDINLYVEGDLPPVKGGPYTIVWDHEGVLDTWQRKLPKPVSSAPNWEEVVHEDERFWAWSFYVYGHLHRGEYYHIADEISALRDVVEQWAARLGGNAEFSTRHLEKKEFAESLFEYDLFPKPERESLKASMLDLIEIQLKMRKEIQDILGIDWKTSEDAIEKISTLIESL